MRNCRISDQEHKDVIVDSYKSGINGWIKDIEVAENEVKALKIPII